MTNNETTVLLAVLNTNITILTALSVILDVYTADSINQTNTAVERAKVLKKVIAETAKNTELLLDNFEQPVETGSDA